MDAVIPHHFHWIWLGDEQQPAHFEQWRREWLELHPGWTWRLWHDDDVPELVNSDLFRAARTWAQKADVLRYELLLTHGGVYLDTDMQGLRNIEELLRGATGVVGEMRPACLGNSFLAAVPGAPWMGELVSALPESVRRNRMTLDQTGPGFLTRVTAGREDVRVLPPELIYPIDSAFRGTSPVPPSSAYAVHHWARSWEQDEVRHLREWFGLALAEVVCPGEHVVLVNEGIDVPLPASCRTRPFLERDGVDWGVPEDDAAARAAIDSFAASGVHWVVFLYPSFWWFSYYPGLDSALRAAATRVVENDLLRAYEVHR